MQNHVQVKMKLNVNDLTLFLAPMLVAHCRSIRFLKVEKNEHEHAILIESTTQLFISIIFIYQNGGMPHVEWLLGYRTYD